MYNVDVEALGTMLM